ncbi:MAG: ISNCY family transposase [Ktedonobacteraceae bacterium]
MARKHQRPVATRQQELVPVRETCECCDGTLWKAYRSVRTIATLDGLYQLLLTVRRCHNRACERYRQPYRPEEEGAWALPHGEFGLDIIALIGTLRYERHQSVPEIHQELCKRGVVIAERTVTNLLARYEELVTLHLTDQTRLRERLATQRHVILALDGLQPDVGHEVLWVLRDCVSGEVLVARSLLEATENDLVPLLEEVVGICQQLAIPISGVITDGQHSIRNAVAHVLPGIPHQLCHFHYLREAAKPVYEADKHAKKELKKHLRGVRPIERAVEQRNDAEAEAIRGYCLAVRSALTDDGRPPLAAPSLKLYERITAIAASLTRVSGKGGLPRELERMQVFLEKGLTKTAALWSDVKLGYAWVHRAAHILTNDDKQAAAQVRQTYECLMTEMEQALTLSETLTAMLTIFRKVTGSYWPGLFHCYDLADLPRTNNDLEQYFGSARYHERRATGRKAASPGVVIRGSVRVVAGVATRLRQLSARDLQPTDVERWYVLRDELDMRKLARRAQFRFRRDPDTYLADLENKLLLLKLPP